MACSKFYSSGLWRIVVSRMKKVKPMYPNNQNIMDGSRVGTGGTDCPPILPEKLENIGFPANTGLDPRKDSQNYKVIIQCLCHHQDASGMQFRFRQADKCYLDLISLNN